MALTDFVVGVQWNWNYTLDIRKPQFLQCYFSYTSFATQLKTNTEYRTINLLYIYIFLYSLHHHCDLEVLVTQFLEVL